MSSNNNAYDTYQNNFESLAFRLHRGIREMENLKPCDVFFAYVRENYYRNSARMEDRSYTRGTSKNVLDMIVVLKRPKQRKREYKRPVKTIRLGLNYRDQLLKSLSLDKKVVFWVKSLFL